MATSTKHTRSIHINAPVEKVFRYVEDPAHALGAMPNSELGAVHLTPEGVGTTYEGTSHMLGMTVTGVVTRGEYLVNERIVDRSSKGPLHTFTFEPDDTGTTLTFGWDASRMTKRGVEALP